MESGRYVYVLAIICFLVLVQGTTNTAMMLMIKYDFTLVENAICYSNPNSTEVGGGKEEVER